ncbi:MAG: hypothetical protein ABFD61_01105 [Chloroherpetonaceae bacterium]
MLSNLLSKPVRNLEQQILDDLIDSAKREAKVISNLSQAKFDELDATMIFDSALAAIIEYNAVIAGYISGLTEERINLLEFNVTNARKFLSSIQDNVLLTNTKVAKIGQIGDLYEF